MHTYRLQVFIGTAMTEITVSGRRAVGDAIRNLKRKHGARLTLVAVWNLSTNKQTAGWKDNYIPAQK